MPVLEYGATQEARNSKDWDAFINDMGQEYDYLFVPGQGWVVRYFSGWDERRGNLIEEMTRVEEEKEEQ